MASNTDDKCSIHHEKALKQYCSTCRKCVCEDCYDSFGCLKKKHNVKPMIIAVDEINKEVSDIKDIANEIEKKLDDEYNCIFDDSSNFKSTADLCKTNIEHQARIVIDKIHEKCNKLISRLNKISKQYNETKANRLKEIELKQTQVRKVTAEATKIINKPQEKEKLEFEKEKILYIRKTVIEFYKNKSAHEDYLIPKFIPSKQLYNALRMEGIGEINCVDNRYKVVVEDQSFTVTKGQYFVVRVSKLTGSATCHLSASLKNVSGEESTAEVEKLENGSFNVKVKCDEEGMWKMKITAGFAQVAGSPVNLNVEPFGLFQTIEDIEHIVKDRVRDVILDKDGCILVSSDSNYILRFDQSGSFVSKIEMPTSVKVNRMHKTVNGQIFVSDSSGKRVILCDDKFNIIKSYGKGILKYPRGLAVNENNCTLYVTDWGADRVFKFNVENCRLLARIGSHVEGESKLRCPCDVIINKKCQVIVADWGHSKIKMFDANEKFVKVFVNSGDEDGTIKHPRGLAMDIDDNVIVSSRNKVQLFDKNGEFIAAIGNKSDWKSAPFGVSVTSNRPRRISVANYWDYTVKTVNC